MTVKAGLNERETLKGKGKLLHPKSGQPFAEGDYTVILYDEFEETFGTTHINVEGGGQVKVFVAFTGLKSGNTIQLTLELEDGRRITGRFQQIYDGKLYLLKQGGFDESSTEPQP